MHQEIIMVVGADLTQVPDPAYPHHVNVRVGPETARVCRKAAALSEMRQKTLVYATAGKSPKHGVLMGAGPMRTFLIESGVPQVRIRFPIAREFTTNGEMEELVQDLFDARDARARTFTVHVVCRWWHLPRAWLLLRARLGKERRARVSIRGVPVWTFADPLGMCIEPARWIKNFGNKNLFQTA